MAIRFSRRRWLRQMAWSSAAVLAATPTIHAAPGRDLRIKRLKVTPIALPDPPILAASGCHGPYFLRAVLELETDEGIVGLGETYGSATIVEQLNQAAKLVPGSSAFAYRSLARPLARFHPAVFGGIEMACLDAVGRATQRRVCELLGGPVRDSVEFAAYLFYRYAADDPRVLDDPRIVDSRGRGAQRLDDWGEVRSAKAMAEMAERFRSKWGFRVLKLKAGVLEPDVEIDTLRHWHDRFGNQAVLRIDPNARWTVPTAIRHGRQIRSLNLPLEYYEDPVAGQTAMADVRAQTGLKLSTNSCVSRWEHIRPATRTRPVDVVLSDIYWFGGITGHQALARAAASLGWGVGYHSNNHAGITMAAMIHAAAATPEQTYAADTHYVWLTDESDVIRGGKLPIKNGRMKIPDGAGLGVELDRDQLARAHQWYRKSGMRDRDDATMMRKMIPGWKRTLF